MAGMPTFYDLGIEPSAGAAVPADKASESNELVLRARLQELIPADQWTVFRRVVACAEKSNLEFALGGAFAVATYTGKWRNTKDMDLYVVPQEREKAKNVLAEAGLTDYFPVKDYDRSWI